MDKIRYGLIGAGWRAAFFMRAARLMPDRFELCGVLCRSEERAREVARQHEVRTFASLDALLDARPEFVVSCVSKAEMPKMTRTLLERGMPVLAETPLATDVEGLETLYAAWRQTGTPLQLAEQYFLWPTHQARRALIDRGLLGDVHHCALSDVHDYHAVSLFRNSRAYSIASANTDNKRWKRFIIYKICFLFHRFNPLKLKLDNFLKLLYCVFHRLSLLNMFT